MSTFFGAESDAEDEVLPSQPQSRRSSSARSHPVPGKDCEACMATGSTSTPCSGDPPEVATADFAAAVGHALGQALQVFPKESAKETGVFHARAGKSGTLVSDEGKDLLQESAKETGAFHAKAGKSGTLVSDEGKDLLQAIREAQAALDAARQFVTSPSLPRPALLSASAAGSPTSAASAGRKAEPGAAMSEAPAALSPAKSSSSSRARQASADSRPPPPVRHRSQSTHSSPRPAAPPRPARTPPAAPMIAYATATSAAALAAELGAEAAGRQRVNALHARFGEAAARSRVSRAKSLEEAQRARRDAEAEAKAAEEAKAAAGAEVQRRRAAQRAASERRAKREEEQKEEELRMVENMRKDSQRATGLRSANSAARRAESERARREALTMEVLSTLHADHAERREAGTRKGRELQERCQASDFAAVDSRWKLPKGRSSSVRCSTPGRADSPDDGASTSLPRILSPRKNLIGMEVTQRTSKPGDKPPLAA
ncbi:unnamed protein product [Polarella glacialis]|uniref:Uncharacterized protein n=1 Tax=Polarella glacialis TaxID=89957 RepID=A0A813FFS1_POLGL|nr:unnamed protein product [Polarella glacialis]